MEPPGRAGKDELDLKILDIEDASFEAPSVARIGGEAGATGGELSALRMGSTFACGHV